MANESGHEQVFTQEARLRHSLAISDEQMWNNWLYKICGGRHTTFAWFFAMTAFILAFRNELTHVYVEVIVALQAYILVHSAKDDWANRNGKSSEEGRK